MGRVETFPVNRNLLSCQPQTLQPDREKNRHRDVPRVKYLNASEKKHYEAI